MIISNLKKWKNGEIFNARDYVYERDLIIAQVNRLASLVGDTQGASAVNLSVNKLTANEIVLEGGDLNDFIRGQAVYTSTPVDAQNGDVWLD